MSRLPASHDPDVLGSLSSSYAVLGEIGRGGMGTVVLAKHRTTGYRVAIKIASTDKLDAEVLERFSREARLMARLRHPNIVQLYGIHEIRANTIAIVMEYVRGKSLAEMLSSRKRLSFDRCRQILRDLGQALSHAHANGVVHRDVKPHNVIIEEVTGKAMLFDFGIAKGYADDESVTAAGGTIGTPAYMSPEQIDGRTIDHRSDIYALGILGWELIVGERPWGGVPLYKLLHKQKHEALPSLTVARPDTPDELLLAIEGALEKSPAGRWSSVDEMVEQLETTEPTRAMKERRERAAAARADVPSVRVDAPTIPVPRRTRRTAEDRTLTLQLPRTPADPSGAEQRGGSPAAVEDSRAAAPDASETASRTAPVGGRIRWVAVFGLGIAAGALVVLATSRLLNRERPTAAAPPAPTMAATAATTATPGAQQETSPLPPVAAPPVAPRPAPVAASRSSVPPWPAGLAVSSDGGPVTKERPPVVELPALPVGATPLNGPTVAAARDFDRRSAALALADQARSLVYGGRADGAAALADSAIRLDSRNGPAYLVRARALIEKKRVREAWTDIELGARSGSRWEAFALTVMLTVRQAGRPEGLAILRPELRDALIPRRPLPADHAVALAVALLQVGDENAALTLLELAQTARGDLLRLLGDPLLAPLRDHSRFLAVRERAVEAAKVSPDH